MTLSEQMKAEGWIEHDGGECPVAPSSEVSLLLRSGSIEEGWTAGKVVWPHNAFIWEIMETIPPAACVIAYRPETGHD